MEHLELTDEIADSALLNFRWAKRPKMGHQMVCE
jgi:hypothetical protein